MTANDSAALVRRFIDSVWNRSDADAADSFLAPGYRDHAYTVPSAEGLKAAIRELAAAIPDHVQVVEDLVADGERVMVRLRLSGTHSGTFRGRGPSGRPIDIRVARWFRIADGCIAEHWALLDTFGLLRQMDAGGDGQAAA